MTSKARLSALACKLADKLKALNATEAMRRKIYEQKNAQVSAVICDG